jgi:hypothetical protein
MLQKGHVTIIAPEKKMERRVHAAAGVLGATTLLLVLLLLDGTEASRYCSYHPEAPECRNVQPRYPPASDWEADPALDQELQEEMEADLAAAISTSNGAGAAVINSTSIAIDSLDGAHLADDVPTPSAVSSPPANGDGEAFGWSRLLLARQARPVFEALGVGTFRSTRYHLPHQPGLPLTTFEQSALRWGRSLCWPGGGLTARRGRSTPWRT